MRLRYRVWCGRRLRPASARPLFYCFTRSAGALPGQEKNEDDEKAFEGNTTVALAVPSTEDLSPERIGDEEAAAPPGDLGGDGRTARNAAHPCETDLDGKTTWSTCDLRIVAAALENDGAKEIENPRPRNTCLRIIRTKLKLTKFAIPPRRLLGPKRCVKRAKK